MTIMTITNITFTNMNITNMTITNLTMAAWTSIKNKKKESDHNSRNNEQYSDRRIQYNLTKNLAIP